MNRNCYEERKEWNMTISFAVIDSTSKPFIELRAWEKALTGNEVKIKDAHARMNNNDNY